MRLFGKRLEDFEAAARSGTEVAWFGSVEIPGGGEEVVGGGKWWHGDELAQEPQGTMTSAELDPRAAGYN